MNDAVMAEGDRLRDLFLGQGARLVQADVLLPADTLLDLYGEDIRGRAYITSDPLKGEVVLRPDFTVPVVQKHMETRADPARYAYQGKVFRKQESDPDRASEYMQVGFEVFDGNDEPRADAEVFIAIMDALRGLPVRAVTGDIGILLSAVKGLQTSDARKAALLRHIWRPRRFRALLDRFAGVTPVPASRVTLLASADPFAQAGPDIGIRSRAEVAARIETLRADAETAPLGTEQMALLDALLTLDAVAPDAIGILRDIAVDLPAIRHAVDQMAARLDALAAGGVDIDTLAFEGSYGRTTLEYYDGFVFGFAATDQPGMPTVATGGRYNALTERLGDGRAAPAVGGVIRPDLVVAIQGNV